MSAVARYEEEHVLPLLALQATWTGIQTALAWSGKKPYTTEELIGKKGNLKGETDNTNLVEYLQGLEGKHTAEELTQEIINKTSSKERMKDNLIYIHKKALALEKKKKDRK